MLALLAGLLGGGFVGVWIFDHYPPGPEILLLFDLVGLGLGQTWFLGRMLAGAMVRRRGR